MNQTTIPKWLLYALIVGVFVYIFGLGLGIFLGSVVL